MKYPRKTLDIAIIISLIPVTLLVIFCAVLLFYPYKTLEVYSVTVKTPVVHHGENLIYTVDYCKYTSAPSIVYRTLRATDDSSIIPFPVAMTVPPQGCHEVDIPLAISKEVATGTYYMAAIATFKINPIRDISVSFKSNNFEIK